MRTSDGSSGLRLTCLTLAGCTIKAVQLQRWLKTDSISSTPGKVVQALSRGRIGMSHLYCYPDLSGPACLCSQLEQASKRSLFTFQTRVLHSYMEDCTQ